MMECKFCAYTPIELTKTPVYLCSDQVPALSYASVTTINTPSITNYNYDTRFTPGARLALSQEQGLQMLTHQQAWRQFLDTKAAHALFLETQMPTAAIENADPPKDWDILLYTTNTDYVLTRRAASLLLLFSNQIHDPLPSYMTSHPLLKVIRTK